MAKKTIFSLMVFTSFTVTHFGRPEYLIEMFLKGSTAYYTTHMRGLALRESHLSFRHRIPTRQTYKSSIDRSYALPTTQLICCCPVLTASFLDIEDETISSIFLFQVRDNEEHISSNFIITQKFYKERNFVAKTLT